MRKTVLIAVAAISLLAAPPAQAGPPGPRPTPVRVAATERPRGLETSEALLEDLNFRNLELHDRAMLTSKPASAKGSKMTFTVNNAGSSVFVPPAASSAPAKGAVKGGGAANLAAYVRLLDNHRRGAIVTGRFSDWRSTSVYRSAAGLHYGYDIAYPAGTPIVAGWSGQVISIANWYGAEHGITVQSPEGFRTTYGHLSPLTRVGAWINPGDVVGRVVNDHVDVKMRNVYGGFIDFAHGVPGLGGSSYAGLPSGPAQTQQSGGRVSLTLHVHAAPIQIPRMLPPLAGPAWSQRSEAVRAAIAYLRVRHQEAALLVGAASPAALAAVHRQVEDARGRLVTTGVPEEVLLAAFVQEDVPHGEFWFGKGLSSDTQVDVVNAGDARRDEMIRSAQEARPKLEALLRDLNAQPPSRS